MQYAIIPKTVESYIRTAWPQIIRRIMERTIAVSRLRLQRVAAIAITRDSKASPMKTQKALLAFPASRLPAELKIRTSGVATASTTLSLESSYAAKPIAEQTRRKIRKPEKNKYFLKTNWDTAYPRPDNKDYLSKGSCHLLKYTPDQASHRPL